MGWQKIRGVDYGPPTPAVDMDAVREMIQAEVRAAIALLPEPARGLEGPPGRDAEPIHPDTIRLMVLTEVQNAIAAMPVRDGRDAYELEILPAIDEKRSYARGTFATHKGGLFRYTGTSWQMVVRGVDTVRVTTSKDDPRLFTIRIATSDGETTESLTIPVPLYRGVYRAGTEYARGDKVTYDGSEWICIVDKTTSSPAKSDEWQLTVKRGRDGKDGKPGPKGDKGDPGMDLRYQ